MARLLALEWGPREARVAVARTRGNGIVVEHAFTVNVAASSGDEAPSEQAVGKALADALASRGVGKTDTLVAVGRANIELKQLTLPPAPPEELPDLVRFQALREFTNIGEDWPIDFVPADASEGDSTSVLAVAISPEMVSQIKATCQTAVSNSPKRLVLRPFAAASLLRRHDQGTTQPCRLMVDLLADEADLTVLLGESVVLMRTVRLATAEDGSVNAKVLVGEIRRTIAAAQNQLRGPRVEKVILCGDGTDQQSLKQEIEEGLSLSVQLFNPFLEMELDSALHNNTPEHAGRFAPLLGMLCDEAADAAHPIDFLQPRKRPEPPSQAKRQAVLGGIAAAALLLLVGGVYLTLASMDSEIKAIQAASNEMQKQVEEANLNIAHLKAVEKFTDSDITWLDELYGLAERLPPPEDAILTQIRVGVRQPSGAQITLDGYTREPEQLPTLREGLRIPGRSVASTGSSADPKAKHHKWRFKETVLLTNTIALDEATEDSPEVADDAEAAELATEEGSEQETPAQ